MTDIAWQSESLPSDYSLSFSLVPQEQGQWLFASPLLWQTTNSFRLLAIPPMSRERSFISFSLVPQEQGFRLPLFAAIGSFRLLMHAYQRAEKGKQECAFCLFSLVPQEQGKHKASPCFLPTIILELATSRELQVFSPTRTRKALLLPSDYSHSIHEQRDRNDKEYDDTHSSLPYNCMNNKKNSDCRPLAHVNTA